MVPEFHSALFLSLSLTLHSTFLSSSLPSSLLFLSHSFSPTLTLPSPPFLPFYSSFPYVSLPLSSPLFYRPSFLSPSIFLPFPLFPFFTPRFFLSFSSPSYLPLSLSPTFQFFSSSLSLPMWNLGPAGEVHRCISKRDCNQSVCVDDDIDGWTWFIQSTASCK